jgi:hypothetical protein
VPELEGQRPPFEPGNTAALRHARSPRRVEPDFGADLASGQNEAQAAVAGQTRRAHHSPGEFGVLSSSSTRSPL